MKYITRIEVNFRTKLVYYASNGYTDVPTWFADPKYMDKSFVNKLPQFYDDKFKKKHKTIQSHHRKYINDIYAPAWKTLEFFSFGSIIAVYESLKSVSIKAEIAKEYGIKSPKTLINFLNTILFIRNICAHGGNFYDCKIRDAVSNTSLISFPPDEKHAPYTAVRVILFMLKQISENRYIEIKEGIEELLQRYSDNELIKNIIRKCMRFSL